MSAGHAVATEHDEWCLKVPGTILKLPSLWINFWGPHFEDNVLPKGLLSTDNLGTRCLIVFILQHKVWLSSCLALKLCGRGLFERPNLL